MRVILIFLIMCSFVFADDYVYIQKNENVLIDAEYIVFPPDEVEKDVAKSDTLDDLDSSLTGIEAVEIDQLGNLVEP